MILESFGTNLMDLSQNLLNISWSSNDVGSGHWENSNMYLVEIHQDQYDHIHCRMDNFEEYDSQTHSSTGRYYVQYTIELKRTHHNKEMMIVISSKNRELIRFVYDAIVRDRDCREEDIKDKFPEAVI